MRKRSVILMVLLLFLSSCGIPSLRDFSSAISFTSSTTDKSLSLKFNSTAVNASYFTNGMINSASPSIILLYTVSNEPEDSVSSSFRNTFNKEVRGGNTNINGVPLPVRETGMLETTYGSNTYYMYPLMPDSRSVAPPQYTLSNGEDFDFTSLTSVPVKFSFECRKVEDTDDEYCVAILKNGESYMDLLRANRTSFRTEKQSEYVSVSDTEDSWYIHIFAAVNVTKSRSSDFSNDYWTELRNVANIKIGE